MNNFKEIKPTEINENTLKLIGDDWTLISAKHNNKVNTMTASWGYLGIMWHLPTAQIFIRPSRYTKEFVDGQEYFSLTFFDEKYKEDLIYLGSVSGRDEDKISKTSITVEYDNDIPYFNEAKLVIFCKKLYVQEFKEECFYDKTLIEKNYPEKDYHTAYIGEIVKVLIKE